MVRFFAQNASGIKTGKKTIFSLSLIKNNHSKFFFIKLQKKDGTITTDPKEILNMQSTFYSNLYTSKSKNQKIK